MTLFFHGAKESRKIEIVKNNNSACFEIDCDTKLIEAEKPFNYGYEFKSVCVYKMEVEESTGKQKA